MTEISQTNKLIYKYLAEGKVMQLATAARNTPWVCTVYYVLHDRNLYWLSWPERRHSREIGKNEYVAAAIVVKSDLPVVGLQVGGEAHEVRDIHEVKAVMEKYTAKYDSGKKFYELFRKGENHHHLYKLTPHKIALFDEVNFAPNDIQAIELS